MLARFVAVAVGGVRGLAQGESGHCNLRPGTRNKPLLIYIEIAINLESHLYYQKKT